MWCKANQQLCVLIVQRGLPSSDGSQAATGKALGRSSSEAKSDITATGGSLGLGECAGDSNLQYCIKTFKDGWMSVLA